MGSTIQGELSSALTVGNSGSGSKSEGKATVTPEDQNDVGVDLLVEVKDAFPQDDRPLLLTDEGGLPPGQFSVHGIYNKGATGSLKAFDFFKAFGDWKLKLGWIDGGRDFNNNPLAPAGTELRTPIAGYWTERPLLNNYPGSNLGVFIGKTGKSSRLFFGVTDGRKSGGLVGFQAKDGETTPIKPSNGSDDPFWQGVFATAGGGIKLQDEDLTVTLDGSISVLTQEKDPPKVMWYGAAALSQNRLTLAADISQIQISGQSDQSSWRFVGDLSLVKEDSHSVSAFVAAASVKATNSGDAETAGVHVQFKPSDQVTIDLSGEVGSSDDDRLLERQIVGDVRGSVKYKFKN